MTQSELEAMLKESELMSYGLGKDGFKFFSACSTFSKLVAAKEREACAKVCESLSLEWEEQPDIAQVELATMLDCALAIRARGEA